MLMSSLLRMAHSGKVSANSFLFTMHSVVVNTCISSKEKMKNHYHNAFWFPFLKGCDGLKGDERPKYFECCPQENRLYFHEVELVRSSRH